MSESSSSVNKLPEKGQKQPTFSENISCQAVLDFSDVTVFVVRLTADENFWIVALRNGIIKLLPTSGATTADVQSLQADGETSCCVDVHCVPQNSLNPSEKNHRLIAAYASGYARIWYYTGATPESRLLASLPEEFICKPNESARNNQKRMNQILTCSCSLDGQRFITGGDDCFIRVYDLNAKKLLRVLGSSFSADKIDGHVMRICALKYHPRGEEYEEYKHVFISGGWDDTVQIWDDRYKHSIWVYAGPHISGSDAIDLEPESNYILTSSWRHESTLLQIWKFNDAAVAQLHASFQTTNDAQHFDQSTSRMDAKETGLAFRVRPIAEVPQESFEMRSKGYVAKWLGPMHIAFGGSDSNVLRIFSRSKASNIASVMDLPNGIYSIAFFKSQIDDFRRPLQLAFAAGSKVYVTRVNRK